MALLEARVTAADLERAERTLEGIVRQTPLLPAG